VQLPNEFARGGDGTQTQSGGAILFDVAKLRDGGGFEFWQELPPNHCGEEHNSG